MNQFFRQPRLAAFLPRRCVAVALSAALAVPVLLGAAAPAHADQAQAVATVRKISQVVDVKAEPGGNMYVIVKPVSADWDNFADAVCTLVKPFQARIFKVRVIEISKAVFSKKPQDWTRLGEASCGD